MTFVRKLRDKINQMSWKQLFGALALFVVDTVFVCLFLWYVVFPWGHTLDIFVGIGTLLMLYINYKFLSKGLSMHMLSLLLVSICLLLNLELSVTSYAFYDCVVPYRQIVVIYINVLSVIFLMIGLYGLIGRWFISEFISMTFFTIYAIVNHYTMLFHGTFLTAEDLSNAWTAANVVSSYHFTLDKAIWLILGIYILACVIIYFEYRYEKKKYVSFKTMKAKLSNGFVRLALVVFCALFYFSVYISDDAIIEHQTDVWSWHFTYAVLGVYVGTVESTMLNFAPVVEKPAEYDDFVMSEVSVDNTDIVAETKPDIIYILNETYYDLSDIMDVDTDVDVMKNYNDMTNAVKGKVVVPLAGGGTNASEYEILTSNSMNLLHIYAPFNRLDLYEAHSTVDYLESLGYSTCGVHCHSAVNYSRGMKWDALGFDELHFIDDFSDCQYYSDRDDNSKITDKSFLENLYRFYEAMPADKPRYIHGITMQNHGDWNSLLSSDYLVHNASSTGDEVLDGTVNEYLSCIKLTDDAIKDLQEYFKGVYEDSGRKVIVCMVGDHCPSFLEDSFDDITCRQTPYFIWANYELENTDETNVMDLAYLTPTVFKIAGLPLSDYFAYMLDMKDEVAVFTNVNGGYYDSDMNYYAISTSLLRNYYCLEFNNCGNNDNRNDAFFLPNVRKINNG